MREAFVVTQNLSIGANEIVAVRCPSKGWITKATIIETGSQSFNATLYNRAFTWGSAANIRSIKDDGNGVLLVETDIALPVALGDELTVAGSLGGYNGLNRVDGILAANKIVTNKAFISNQSGGTITLTVQTVEQPLYKVMAITGTSGLGEFTGSNWVSFINSDPLPAGRASKGSPSVYFKTDTTGVYRISLSFLLPP
jgi:hypothetical protein